MFKHHLWVWVFLSTGIAVAGCGSPYVNIPPQSGDLATHSPNSKNVLQVLTAVMGTLIDQMSVDGPVAVILPAGASELSHVDVAAHIGEPAVSIHKQERLKAIVTVEATEVRIRGLRAEVDVLTRGLGGPGDLKTAYLAWRPVSGWQVTHVRTWRGLSMPTFSGSVSEVK